MVKIVRVPLVLLLCLIFCLCMHTSAFAGEAVGLTAQEGAAAVTRLVTVSFVNEELESFSGLSVYDSAGQLCTPLTDSESGAVVYGSYQLSPGNYSFRFHDDDGKYEDLDGEFRVYEDQDRQFVSLDPVPHLDIQILSTAYINPAYIGVITEEDLPESTRSDEELIEEMRQLFGVGNNDPHSARFRTTYLVSSISSAGTVLRRQMLAFDPEPTIKIQLQDDPAEAANYSSTSAYRSARWSEMAVEIYRIAVKHTGISTQGDYLRYECGGYEGKGAIGSTSSADTCIYTFYYYPHYFASAEQEAELTPVVNSILAELSLTGKSNYEKIQAIYQYLTDHVRYDYVSSDSTKYTAYAALVEHLAVCQGYATAFYRLCLESGIDARIITSKDMVHAWNIVRFGGQYYEMDATWDRRRDKSSTPAYQYFLLGSTSWLSSHTLGDEFNDPEYAAKYVLPVYDFADVQKLPINYTDRSLEGRIKGPEDKIAALAKACGSTVLGLDEICIQFSYRKNAEGNTDETASYEIYPVIAAYNQGKSAKAYKVGNESLIDGPVFPVTLPVPNDWVGKTIDYTISASGYEDIAGSANVVQSSSDSCTVTLKNAMFFGNVNMEFAKPDTQFKVSFDSMGGSAVETQYVLRGGYAVQPVPVKTGFWFGGWYTDKTYSAAFDLEKTPITGDIMLYARWIVPDLVLPAALTELEEEAFAGGAFSFVQLPDQTETIGSRAFADCPNLAFIYIPAGVQFIDPSAFGDIGALTVYGKTGSAAESFAAAHGYTFIAMQ